MKHTRSNVAFFVYSSVNMTVQENITDLLPTGVMIGDRLKRIVANNVRDQQDHQRQVRLSLRRK